MNTQTYIATFLLPPFILAGGLFGNLMGFLVLLRRQLNKIGPIYIYRLLFVMDTIYLLCIIPKYLQFGFNINMDNISAFWCKFNRYFVYSYDAISPMLRVYISIEKYICIRHPNEKLLLNKNKNQIVFFIAVLAFNIFYYLSVVFYQDLVNHYPAINLNGSNQSREIFCDFISTSSQFVISLMDFVNLIAVPFAFMITFSILLVRAIFVSRNRVMKSYTSKENKSFQRDIRLAVTLISLNLIYLILNLPLAVIVFSSDFTDFIFMMCIYLFLASYAVNFYIILLTNSLFRRQFIDMFMRRNILSHTNRSTYFETTNHRTTNH